MEPFGWCLQEDETFEFYAAMPLTQADQRRVDEAEAEARAAGSTKLLVRVPPESQKLGSITVMCLIMNRSIGELAVWVESKFKLLTLRQAPAST